LIKDINAGTVKHTYVQITGTVSTAHNETDGDVHLHVNDISTPITQDVKLVWCKGAVAAAPANALVCEIVPESPIIAPAPGAKVTISGTLRYDLEHSWPEIHPVASIQIG